ncbi:hypothetical protein D3C87_1368920 [compost metagenome]
MKKKIILGILAAIILVIGGYYVFIKLEDKEIARQATEVATHYFKDKYNLELIITDYQIYPSYVNDEVVLSSHIKGDEEAFLSISLDYTDDYKLTGVSGAEWLIKKYNISVTK